MRHLELSVIMLSILAALAAAGLWLWTEWSHHHAAVLVDRILTDKPLDTLDTVDVLADFPSPYYEILPGKHLFYGSTLAVAAADLPEHSEATRLKWISQARKALPVALAREPAYTHAWVHLAYAEWLDKGANQRSVDALRMSIYTSPADTQLLSWRLKLAGLNRDFWDPGFQDLVLRQVALAWRHNPKSLSEIATAYHIDDLVRQTLSDDPMELARFNALAANPSVRKHNPGRR